jgi:hypothetical protein
LIISLSFIVDPGSGAFSPESLGKQTVERLHPAATESIPRILQQDINVNSCTELVNLFAIYEKMCYLDSRIPDEFCDFEYN